MNHDRTGGISLARKIPCLALFLVALLYEGGRESSAGIQSDFLTISGEVTSRTGAKGPVVIEVYQRPLFSHRPLSSPAAY